MAAARAMQGGVANSALKISLRPIADFTTFYASTHGGCMQESDKGMEEEARIQLQTIIDGIPAPDRLAIAGLPRERVISLHRTLGRWIRNRYRSGEFVALFRWSRSQLPDHLRSMDDLSEPILVEIWRILRSEQRN